MLTIIFLGCLMAQDITLMSHILSYIGHAVAPRKQKQALAIVVAWACEKRTQ